MMAAKLFGGIDAEAWRAAYQNYRSVLQKFADTKKKKELCDLDQWYQIDLPKAIQLRQKKHISKEELVKLVKWKLTRGKFRPRLTQLAASNGEDDVITVTSNAARLTANADALKEMCRLKGVGPATASAVLCALHPDEYPFMADEAVAGVFGSTTIKYTASEYDTYAKRVREKAKWLCKQDPTTKWDPHKVELALWAQHHATSMGVDISIERKRKSLDVIATNPKERKLE